MTGRLPPGSLGTPYFGEAWAFIQSPFLFLDERRKQHGAMFKSRVLGRNIVFLSGIKGAETFYDRETIDRVNAHPWPLVELFGGVNMEMYDGPRHLALKSMAIGAFGRSALAAWLPTIETLTGETLARLADGPEFSATAELRRLAVDEIAANVLGLEPGPVTETMTRDCALTLLGLVSVPFVFLQSTYARAHAARNRLLALIRQTIAARRKEPRDDGLSRMLKARAADGRTYTDEEALLEIQHILLGGIIVFALMVEAMRQLAEQPRLLAQCAAEIDATAGAGPLTLEMLANLPAANRVVLEAKRFVPLVPLAFGRAIRDFTFGGFDVPKGWAVHLALWLNNRDPATFADAGKFDPDRFAPPRAETEKHPLAYLPQGAGPRTGHQCLGLDYSTVLVLAFIVHLVRDYRWQLPAQRLDTDWSKLPPEPSEGLRVRLMRRSGKDG